MKVIEIYSDYRCMIINALTVYDAIMTFQRRFPKERVTFAHDTKYSPFTKQFQNGSKQVSKG